MNNILAITRHSAAKDWLCDQFPNDDVTVHSHYTPGLEYGFTLVVGILPLPLIANLNKMGIRFMLLTMNVPEEFRGVELTKDQMVEFGAKLEEYQVMRCEYSYYIN